MRLMQFRRRREKKTDYQQRLALLRSRKPRLVVRRTSRNIHAQLVSFTPAGDVTLVEQISKNLRKFGWLGHTGSVPAAYLTGLLVGFQARKAGVAEAVLDIGLQTSAKGSAIYACCLGAKDAGLKVGIGEEIAPSKEQVRGSHIAKYAALLRRESEEKYKRQFAAYLAAGIEPEKTEQHFEEVRKKIISEFGQMKSKEVVEVR